MGKNWRFLLQVAVVYIVVFVPSPEKETGLITANPVNCSREGSSIVRHFVQTVWKPIFKKFDAKMPEECPLHFSHDVFKVRSRSWFMLSTKSCVCVHVFLGLAFAFTFAFIKIQMTCVQGPRKHGCRGCPGTHWLLKIVE